MSNLMDGNGTIVRPPPGEYVFSTCANPGYIVLSVCTDREKSGWKKRDWLRVWSLSISSASTTTSALQGDR